MTISVTQSCHYKGAFQSTNSGVCIAEQVGLKFQKNQLNRLHAEQKEVCSSIWGKHQRRHGLKYSLTTQV